VIAALCWAAMSSRHVTCNVLLTFALLQVKEGLTQFGHLTVGRKAGTLRVIARPLLCHTWPGQVSLH
jgi:hypothetical protein